MNSPLKPSATLLCKLGSMAVHLDEWRGDGGVQIDYTTAMLILDDPEVYEWLSDMTELGLLPLKR